MAGNNKKTKEQLDRILDDIKRLRNDKTEQEIMGLLAIEYRTFRRYMEIINKQDKEAWLNITRTQLEPELLKLKSSLEHTYNKALEEVDNATNTQDRLLALETKDDARLNIVHLITEGPDYIKHVDEYVKENQKKMVTKPETTN